MRRLIFACIAALTLTACDPNSIIAKIQSASAAVCGLEPTAEMAAQILAAIGAGIPGEAEIAKFARQFCAGATAHSLTGTPRVLMVRGVAIPIKAQRVR